MKGQSIFLSICFIALFSEAVSLNTFHYNPLADCGGVLCTSSQYCDEENVPRPVCRNKLNLGEGCSNLGQCQTSNSECLGDPLQCRCNSAFVQIQNACVPSCADKECQPTFFCHETLTGCLPKVNLNGDCDPAGGAQQCKSENAECNNAKCTCASEFVEKNGICIAKCKDSDSPSSCTAIEFCDSTSGLCEQKKPLHEDCADTKECLTPNSACEANKCECESDAFVELYGTCLADCVKNSTACDPATQYCSSTDRICNRKANLHERCSDPTEGSCITENAVCSPGSNTCECDTGFTAVGSTCITVCTDDNSCPNPSDQFCNSESGQCETKKPLGQPCSATVKCSTDLQCLNQVCSCQDDSVETVVNGTRGCTKKCEDNASCEPGKELFCSTILGLCTPQLGLNGVCNLDDVNEEKEINPCKTPSASCKLPSDTDTVALCLCNSDFVQDGISCVAKCQNNADCQSDDEESEQKFCHLSTGVCEPKVPTLEGGCLPPADATEQCLIPNSDCTLNDESNSYSCQCVAGYKARNGKCDLICQDSNQCSANEYCDRDASEFCMAKVGLNQACSYEDQCSNSNAECLGDAGQKKCQCITNYVDVSGTCKPDCRALSNCSPTQFCFSGDGQCRNRVGLNSPCSSAEECLFSEESTECSSNRCKCKTEEYYEEFNTCLLKCTKVTGCDFTEQFCNSLTSKCDPRVDLNGTCTVEGDEQCTALSTCQSISETSKRCRCLPEAIASLDNKKCLKIASVIGDDCKEPQQCSTNITDSECNTQSLKCDCNAAFVGSSNGKKCLRLASAIGDMCEEPQQCSVPALIGNSGVTNTTDCTTNKCDCAASSIKAEGKCYLNKALGDVCVQDVECSVSISGGKCDTASNKCICNEGTEGSVGTKQCSKPSGGASPVNAKFHPVWAILALITSFCFLP